ncbi:MAG: hypothetical protein KDA96_08450 [Planctomycetaceae bacterium]|nr:hypothetical protein [Planctomycetaceae bacterium]
MPSEPLVAKPMAGQQHAHKRPANGNPVAERPAAERVHQELDELVARLRREIWLGGSLAVGAAALLALAAILIADAFLQPQATWVRFAFWIPAITVPGYFVRRSILRPLLHDSNRLDMAWRLEQKRPEIEERLTTTLQFASAADNRTAALVDAVAQQAHRRVSDCREESLRGRNVAQAAVVAAAGVLLTGLLFWIWSPYLQPALANVLMPWSPRVLPRLNADVRPGNATVAEGHEILVQAIGKRMDHAVLEVLHDGAVHETYPMVASETGHQAEFLLTDLTHDQMYRVRSGGLFSDEFQITVNPAPVVDRIAADLIFPEHTGLAPQTIDPLPAAVDVVHGTQVHLSVHSSLPIAECTLEINGTRIPCRESEQAPQNGMWISRCDYTATESENQQGRITLLSAAGVSSEPTWFELHASRDLPPQVRIEHPKLPQLAMQPDQKLGITFHVQDDFGIQSLQLCTQRNSEPPESRELGADEMSREIREETVLDPSILNLSSGDQLTIWLAAVDNRPESLGGPQRAESEKRHITLIDDAVPVGQQAVERAEEQLMASLPDALHSLLTAQQLAEKIQATLQQQEQSRAQVEQTSKEAETATADPEQPRQLLERIQNAERILRQLTDGESEAADELFAGEVSRIRQVTDEEIANARQQAGLIPLSDNAEQQQQAAIETQRSLENAIRQLEDIQAAVKQQADRLTQAAKLDNLAQQQEQLAQELQPQAQQQAQQERPNAPEPVQPQEPMRQQKQVANALQDIVEQDPDARSRQFQQRAEEAEQLTERAGRLQQQQRELAEFERNRGVPQDGDQNRSDQKQVEQLLDMLAKEQQQLAQEAEELEQNPNLQEQAARDAEQQRLVKQQQRLQEAVDAAKDGRPEDATSTLQEQIAERTEQLHRDAEQLLQLPTTDEDNRLALREAQEKIQQARDETQMARDLKNAQQQPAQQQPAQQQPAQQQPAQQQPAQQQPAQQQPAQQQPAKQQPAQKNGSPQQTVQQQQEKAAQSLEEAAQSLNRVCQSCQKCSQCNKPGSAGGSSGAPREASSRSPGSAPGEKKQAATAKPASQNQDAAASQSPDSPPGDTNDSDSTGAQQLANAADKAHRNARQPSQQAASKLADDLNDLADQAASEAGYPYRRKSGEQRGTKEQQSADAGKPRNPSGRDGSKRPVGATDSSGREQTDVGPSQLRGRSTSSWTQARRKLRGSVLDDHDANVPQEFRGIVNDYFEELSRMESRPATPPKEQP